MGIFSKKADKKASDIPKLPELPRLPSEFPELGDSFSLEEPHELPSFPTSATGEKFSRDTIKSAIIGEDKEEDNSEFPKVSPPSFTSLPAEPPKKIAPPIKVKKDYLPSQMNSKQFGNEPSSEKGPVFVRIDKFENALELFKKTREEVGEIEKLFDEIKELKTKEENELSNWERELQNMKGQIEKINENLFSKI